jgi:hypothetical protein
MKFQIFRCKIWLFGVTFMSLSLVLGACKWLMYFLKF